VIKDTKKDPNKCLYPCNYGMCYDTICDCDSSFFGRNCLKQIYQKRGDKFSEKFNFKKYDLFNFVEYLELGHMDMEITLTSEDQPRMMIFASESSIENKSLAIDFKGRFIKNNKTLAVSLFNLSENGKETRVLVAQDKWVYLTFISFDDGDVRIQIKSKKKSNNFSIGKRGNHVPLINYILYCMIVIFVIFVFVNILCLACLSKRRAELALNRRNMDNQVAAEEEEEEESSEEFQNDITLTEEDYLVHFPLCNLAKRKEEGQAIYQESCTICLDDYGTIPVRLIPICGHIFHEECLFPWVKMNESCPNCKVKLDKGSLEAFRKLEKETLKQKQIKKEKEMEKSKITEDVVEDRLDTESRLLNRKDEDMVKKDEEVAKVFENKLLKPKMRNMMSKSTGSSIDQNLIIKPDKRISILQIENKKKLILHKDTPKFGENSDCEDSSSSQIAHISKN